MGRRRRVEGGKEKGDHKWEGGKEEEGGTAGGKVVTTARAPRNTNSALEEKVFLFQSKNLGDRD